MTIVDEFRRDEGRVLDRLIDGELSQTDRRKLLAALDDEPAAWRRCALAFLEAQSWRWQLGKVAAEPLVAQTAAEASRPHAATWGGKHRRTFWATCLTMAASLLVAFGLGTRYPTIGPAQLTDAQAGRTQAVAQQAVTQQADVTNAVVPSTEGPVSQAADQSPWATLTLASAGDAADADSGKQFEVRVREADPNGTALADLLSAGQSPLPAALVNQLEQEGWNVTRQRHLLPVDLSDGRRMVVPVEQVDIRQPEVVQF